MAKKKTTATSKQKKTTAPAGGASMIDTSLAAKMLAAKAKLQSDASTEGSGLLNKVKQGLNKPASASLGNALGSAFGDHKSNLPQHGPKQVAHNQTQGAGRFNVPRRTNG